jgi:hypothetical protein
MRGSFLGNVAQDTIIAAGDRAFVVYTLTNSQPWPSNVIGFNSFSGP